MTYQEDLELIAKTDADKIRHKKTMFEWETNMSRIRREAEYRDYRNEE